MRNWSDATVPTNFRTSPRGRAFLKSNEGLILRKRYDAKGCYSIGYGHDIRPGEDFDAGITKEQADLLLSGDLAEFEAIVNAALPNHATQSQFDALTDFTYELGGAALRQLLAHGWDQIPTQILRWHLVDGKPNDGVLERRKKDLAMWQEVTA